MNRSKIIALLCILALALVVICSCDTSITETSAEATSTPIEESSEIKSEAIESSEVEATEETESTTAKPAKVTYTVTVVDEAGNPIAGATVQLCVGDLCKLPSPTNAQGVATFEFDEAEYTVKVNGGDPYSFPEGSTEITIVLTAN